MAANNSTIKAERTVINLGGILLEVFQMPNGEYRLSQTQILEIVSVSRNWFSAVMQKSQKVLKYLQDKGFSAEVKNVSVPNSNNVGSATAKTLSVDDAVKIWGYFVRQGNEQAADLLEACAAESIERRADKAFGKKRTEEEYNDRNKERREGKNVRLTLTDAIKSYLERTPELSNNSRKFMYPNVTDRINRGVFGRCAKELRQDFKCDNPRDAMTPLELRYVKETEDLTARLIEYTGLEPMEAATEAIRRLEIPEQDRVA